MYRRRRNLAYFFFITLLALLLVLKWHEWHKVQNSYESYKIFKFVLIWTPIMPIFNTINNTPDNDEGFDLFLENECEYTNCILTANRKVLDLTEFDAIIFSAYGVDINYTLPWKRSPRQKYILASLESPQFLLQYFGIKDPVYFLNNFFNWTWTYRLNSDILWRYFIIYDLDGREVGPKTDVKWLRHFKPLKEKVKNKLKSKSKAVAWIASHCSTFSRREYYVKELTIALKKYNLSLDTYGFCGTKKCGNNKKCSEMIKRDYYFYLAFENSFDVDYVTEKLLWAIHNNAVPVVLGGANYTRFLPPGSYLDARKLNSTQMAETMRDIISNFTLYQEYFRWTNHYKYKGTHRQDTCNLCNILNNEEKVNEVTVYPDIKRWWTGAYIVSDVI